MYVSYTGARKLNLTTDLKVNSVHVESTVYFPTFLSLVYRLQHGRLKSLLKGRRPFKEI